MATLKLLCLPYSGASAMVYGGWRRKLHDWLELLPVELPGRGARLQEPLQTDLHALAAQLAHELLPALDKPYALFGHSLGALLAFEIAHAMRRLGGPEPLALFASAAAAPTQRESHRKNYAACKSDAQLMAVLRDLGGTAADVLANDELMSLTLPVLRADLLLCGRYVDSERDPLSCPIHVLGGKEDRITVPQLLEWRRESAAGFTLDMFGGGHFFLREQEPDLLRLIQRHLALHLRRLRSLGSPPGRVLGA